MSSFTISWLTMSSVPMSSWRCLKYYPSLCHHSLHALHHYIITSLHHYIITSLHHRTLCNRLLCRCSLCHRSLPRRHGPNFDDQKSEKVCDLWYIRLIRNLCHQCCHRFSFGRLILANNSRGSRKHCLYLHCHNRLL